jgi:hypothetical protein
MAIVRDIITDALMEIGVLEATETPEAAHAQLALRYFQRQLDAWRADRLTLSQQKRTVTPVPPGTGTLTIGPLAAQLLMVAPTWLDALSYVIPGSSPAVEVPIALLDSDTWASITIKGLPSQLPLQAFYETDIHSDHATLQLWPAVTQTLTIVLYSPEAVDVPASLDTVLIAPAGYSEAFHYQLALRLCAPFGIAVTQGLLELSTRALATAKRPNVAPGLLGIDAALVPGFGAGYNILSDSTNSRGR